MAKTQNTTLVVSANQGKVSIVLTDGGVKLAHELDQKELLAVVKALMVYVELKK